MPKNMHEVKGKIEKEEKKKEEREKLLRKMAEENIPLAAMERIKEYVEEGLCWRLIEMSENVKKGVLEDLIEMSENEKLPKEVRERAKSAAERTKKW
jgi:ribosome biogenesis GTPase A